ncbi:MAG: TonB family protein, partial [Sphingobacteriaceae bacterium]
FKGGQMGLSDFLSANIVYPEFSRQHCISAIVQVSFKLNIAGKVTAPKIERGTGIDLDDEALRVIKLTSGKWVIPAGYDTTTQVILPVKFNPDQTRCGGTSRKDIDMAVMAYKNRQTRQDVLIHYYKNKREGKANTNSEANMIKLKKQLGFDDDFIADILNQAKDKLKQKDKNGACENWYFIRNIGSDRADKMIDKYCK